MSLAHEHLVHLLLHLFLHFQEDALTFLAFSGYFLNSLEGLLESVAEPYKVVRYLNLLIEGYRLCLVVYDCLDKAFTVAFVEEHFNGVE